MMSKTFHNLSFVGQNLHSCLASIWETSCQWVSSQFYINGVVSNTSRHVMAPDQIMARLFVSFVLVLFISQVFIRSLFLVSLFLWLPFGVSWVRSFSTHMNQEKSHFYQYRNFPDGILAKRELLNPGMIFKAAKRSENSG